VLRHLKPNNTLFSRTLTDLMAYSSDSRRLIDSCNQMLRRWGHIFLLCSLFALMCVCVCVCLYVCVCECLCVCTGKHKKRHDVREIKENGSRESNLGCVCLRVRINAMEYFLTCWFSQHGSRENVELLLLRVKVTK